MAGRTFWDYVCLSGFAGASLLVATRMSDPAVEAGDKIVLVYAPWMSAADAIARASASGARL